LGTSRDQAFRTVVKAIQSPIVQAAAGLGGGTDVIVRIISDGSERAPTDTNTNNIASNNLATGSITIVPEAGVNFELNLDGKPLILERGNKLQGFSITSGNPSGAAAAIEIRAGGTPLKDMVINCRGITTSNATRAGDGDKCVYVTSGLGTVTLENVRIAIPSDKNFVTGILHEGIGTLKVTNGSSVVAVGSGNAKGVVGIYGRTPFGSVEVVGSIVSLSAIQATGGNVFAVLLSPIAPAIAPGRVEGSSIQVKNSPSATAIGVCVNASGTVTVQGNTFTNAPQGNTNTSIAIYRQAGNVVPTPMPTGNTFNGFSTSPDNRYAENRPGLSCP
jgi:hypothetical protein